MDELILIIASMAAVTFIPRALPMLLTENPRIGFLEYLPVAIFASLVFPDILSSYSQLAFSGKTIAGLVAFIVAWRTRNIIATMVAGVLIMYLITRLGGL